eukprot:1190512-Pyramimonas_sp.AAC.1
MGRRISQCEVGPQVPRLILARALQWLCRTKKSATHMTALAKVEDELLLACRRSPRNSSTD